MTQKGGVNFAGVYKVLYKREGRKFIKSFREEYQVVKMGRDYYGCGEEHNGDKRNGKIINSIILRLLGRISSWGRGRKGETKSRLKWGWARISSC